MNNAAKVYGADTSADDVKDGPSPANTGTISTPSTPSRSVKRNAMLLTIDIDDFIDIVMEAWTEQASDDNKLMKILCENNQLDDNTDLNLQEFTQILNVCTQSKIPERCVFLLWIVHALWPPVNAPAIRHQDDPPSI
jgi:hypothetical protein